MDGPNVESQTDEVEPLNYFNYFTEVEEEFVRRRGKPLLISPLDWALVETWKDSGIPLHIVLRAINQAFDGYEARGPRYQKVNSVFYCQQAVETLFAEYRLSQVGSTSSEVSPEPASEEERKDSGAEKPGASPFSREMVLDFIRRSATELAAAADAASGRSLVEDAINRARARLTQIDEEIRESAVLKPESLETDLDAIDRMIVESIRAASTEEELKSVRREAEGQLKGYRKKMDDAIYKQTLENFVRRRLREKNLIPRLSLFYL